MTNETAIAPSVVLRPIASPLPLGFLALTIATVAVASVQLSWVPVSEGRTVALGVLVLAVPLQLLSSVMGFLARDPVAATGMGILAGTWGAVCLATLTTPPGATSAGLGVILLTAAASLLVPVMAARSKIVPALVIATSACRFAVTGIAEVDGSATWMQGAGWTGIALAAVSAYAALALALEASSSRTVLPLGRRAGGAKAVESGLDQQVEQLANEPGVRHEL